MKFLLPIAVTLGLVSADFADMKQCIQDKCPSQYEKCVAKSGCEAKLEKCAGQCGTGVNTSCWQSCLGCGLLNIGCAQNNAAICAVNQGCNQLGMEGEQTEFSFEELGRLIDNFLEISKG